MLKLCWRRRVVSWEESGMWKGCRVAAGRVWQMTALNPKYLHATSVCRQWAAVGFCYLGQFKAYENRFIHITRGDTVESVADYAAHPRALQSAYCDCISNWCWRGIKKNQTVKVNVCPAGPCIYLQTHINREANTGRRKVIREEKGWQQRARHRMIALRDGHDTAFKHKHLSFWIHTCYRGLRIKWDFLTISDRIRGRRREDLPMLPASFLACQPPTDPAINLQYKRSLISGSLILKWIIIWLH